MKKITIQQDMLNKIESLYSEGMSMYNIGKEVGYSKPTIKKALEEQGVSIKKPKRVSQKTIDEFVKMFKQTGSTETARKEVRIGHETALKIVKKYKLNENKVCLYCGSNKIIVLSNGITYPCCEKCKSKHFSKINAKREKNVIATHGVRNINQLPESVKKAKETNIKKYGYSHPLKNPEVYAKYKQTLLAKTGEDNIFKTKEFKERLKEYNQVNFKVDHVSQREDVKLKISNSHKNISSEEQDLRNKKRKISVNNKYNCDYSFQDPAVKQKINTTMLDKYGDINPYKSSIIRQKMHKTKRNKYWNYFNILLKEKFLTPLFDKEYYSNILNKEYKYSCIKCNKIITTDKITPIRIWCGCDKSRSHFEDDIISWLNSIGITKIEPNKLFRDPVTNLNKYEIDVFLPDLNLGIDFHGTYWHSNLYKSSNYHKDKYLFFKNSNINLIQVFEIDWINKEHIVKSIIKNKLKLNASKIYARSCVIKAVLAKDSKIFLEMNHLQGPIHSKVNMGLYYKEELVALLNMSKNRYSTTEEWEVIRFTSKTDTTIIGGFERLLKYFIDQHTPKNIVSFVNVNYFTGDSLSKLGFTLAHHTKPNYFYFKSNDVIKTYSSRIVFQKHKLKKLLPIFKSELSEWNNMQLNGYLRIFDAGNLKFVWKNND